MKYLLHSTLTFSAPSRAILYDEAEKLAKNGHEVYVLYCGRSLNVCYTNMNGDTKKCTFCTANYQFYDRINISSKVKFISLKESLEDGMISNNLGMKFHYENVNDIKNIKYKNVNIGYACLSSYISFSRNLYPLIDDSFKVYFDNLLRNSCLMCDLIEVLLIQYKPDFIYGYNGRFLDSRPTLEFSKSQGVHFALLEAQYTFSYYNKIVFYNDTPHSIASINKNLILEIWDHSNLGLDEKITLATEFYERRKKALPSGDKIYTKNQKQGLLPKGWDSTKKNIVIFLSSEDEFIAIGDEFEKYSIFSSQIEGINDIAEFFLHNQQIQFYVRIHPNLSDIDYSYHKKIYELEKFANVKVIEPKSIISSYSLIDNSDTVVVFGSTIGIEAVYWGKPTILLSWAVYYYLDCCYIPSSKEEVFELINTHLVPKDKLGTYKFGLTYHDSVGQVCEFVDCNCKNYTFKIFGYRKTITLNNWEKLFGSRFLFFALRAFLNLPLKLYCSFMKFGPVYQVPTREIEY